MQFFRIEKYGFYLIAFNFTITCNRTCLNNKLKYLNALENAR